MFKSIKIIIWVVVVIIIIALVWIGIANKQPVEEGENIKIGATLPLTGSLAYIGQHRLNGLQMAIDEINEKGGIKGRKIELIAENNQGDSKGAINNVSKLINVDGVDMIFSSFTHITTAIKDIVQDNNKILFYASTVKDFANQDKYTFRDYFSTDSQGFLTVDLIKKLGYQEVALLTEISDTCFDYINPISEGLKDNIVAEEKFDPGAKTLKTEILKIADEQPDVLVTCTWRHSNILMRELKELGLMNIPTIQQAAPSLPVVEAEEFRELFRENKTISTWYGLSEKARTDNEKVFWEKYENKFQITPAPDALYSYDDIYIIADVLKKCDGIVENDCFAEKALSGIFNGVEGELKFDEGGNLVREDIFIKIGEDLKWEEIDYDSL